MTMTQTIWDAMTPAQRDAARDLSGLVPELVGLEGWRIEATYPEGDKKRYYVSRSNGWRPCHIEVLNRRSFGGAQVWWPAGTTFRKLYKR